MDNILSGIKPTGQLTLGNYIGAIKNFAKAQNEGEAFLFIADLHALNAIHDAKEIKQHTYEIAALMIAMGLNLENSIFFRQSDIDKIPSI